MQVDDLIERRKVKTESGVGIEVVTEEVRGEAKIVLSGPVNSAHIITEDITAAQACPFSRNACRVVLLIPSPSHSGHCRPKACLWQEK